jgi:hypothetical protein
VEALAELVDQRAKLTLVERAHGLGQLQAGLSV